MILQIATDTRLVEHRCDPELRQPGGGTDAGELQDLRRSHGTG
jgi:hypothetical protein